MASRSRVLYTGVTNHLVRRVTEHKEGECGGFTKTCYVSRLVYYEVFGDVRVAIARERQIKGMLRAKKIALIESMNSSWKDLSEEWSRKARR